MTQFSVLDNVLLSSALFKYLMTSVTATQDINNLSDHKPIARVLHLAIFHITVPSNQGLQQRRVSWIKANNNRIKNHREVLIDGLKYVVLPVNALICHIVRCRHDSHRLELDTYAREIIGMCYESSRVNITQAGASGKRIPGWSEFVKPFRQKSAFWHSLWTDGGRSIGRAYSDRLDETHASGLSLRYWTDTASRG
jgi:hypothetical protein